MKDKPQPGGTAPLLTRRTLLRLAGAGLTASFVTTLAAGCGAAPAPTALAGAATQAPAAGASGSPGGGSAAQSVPSQQDGWAGPVLTTKPITLRVLRQTFPIQEQDNYFKDIYAKFTAAHPNITIQDEPVPFGELFQKIQTTVAAGNPPDIMLSFGDFVAGYVANNIPLALDEYLTKEFMDDIVPATRTLHTVKGKLYMMPWEQQIMALFFNKDTFKAAGVEMPPETPNPAEGWTWEQTREAWRKLAKVDSSTGQTVWPLAPSIMGPGGPGSNYWYEGMYLRSMGDNKAAKDSSAYRTFQAVSDDGLKVSGYVDTPKAAEGMKFYQSIFTEKFSPLVGIPNSWYDGKATTFLNADTTILRTSQLNVKFNWGVTPVPRGTIQFSHASAAGFMVSAKSQHPVEAVALLVFMDSKENRLRWHGDIRGTLPAQQSLFDLLPRYTSFPYNLMLNTLKQVGYPPPLTPGSSEYQAAMNTAIKDIANGADPAGRLQQVAKTIDDQLQKYK